MCRQASWVFLVSQTLFRASCLCAIITITADNDLGRYSCLIPVAADTPDWVFSSQSSPALCKEYHRLLTHTAQAQCVAARCIPCSPRSRARKSNYFNAKIFLAACSPTVTMYEVGLVVMCLFIISFAILMAVVAMTYPGKMEASTTWMLSVPYTCKLVSTTAVPPLSPLSVPILAVPIQWLARRAEGVLGRLAT